MAILFALALASCTTIPDQISPEWTEAMFFKNAQQAMDLNQYETALHFYEVFLIRFPENIQQGIAAEYERAFVYYKMGQYEIAQQQFQTIIRKYDEGPYAMLYHPRFRYLCEIGLKRIEKNQAVNRRLFWRLAERKWAEENGESLTDTEEDPIS